MILFYRCQHNNIQDGLLKETPSIFRFSLMKQGRSIILVLAYTWYFKKYCTCVIWRKYFHSIKIIETERYVIFTFSIYVLILKRLGRNRHMHDTMESSQLHPPDCIPICISVCFMSCFFCEILLVKFFYFFSFSDQLLIIWM